jgi:hypothetical protein
VSVLAQEARQGTGESGVILHDQEMHRADGGTAFLWAV